MRWAAVLAAVIMVLPAAAQAAPFGERPFQELPGDEVATCLQATGTPGGLALYRPHGIDLLSANADVAARHERVEIGPLGTCAETVVASSGAAVVAGWRPHGRGVRAVVRDPGGAFGTSVSLGSSEVFLPALAVAISPGGHAVVAWAEGRGSIYDNEPRMRVVAARRAPGGAFGPAEQLSEWEYTSSYGVADVRAGIDASGVATVVWARGLRSHHELAAVWAATAAPGAGFAPRRLTGAAISDRPALAVAPDGWALVAHNSYGGTRAYERRPGATEFARLASIPGDLIQGPPAVAVREGGGGIVAWRTDPYLPTAGVRAAVRAGPGPFGAPQDVAQQPGTVGSVFSRVARRANEPPGDFGRADLGAALALDGRALLAWTARRSEPSTAMTTHVASGTLAGGFDAPAALGGTLRDVNGVAPLFLPDGRAALAWTDNHGPGAESPPSGGGRLHLAVEGASPRPQPAPPRLTLSARRTQRIHATRSPRMVGECDRPCDLRVLVGSERGFPSFTLRANRPTRIPLPSIYEGLPTGAVRVPVLVSASGATPVARRTLRIRVVLRPPRPVPAPLDVRAERDGNAIVVRWRSAAAASGTTYRVTGLLRRSAIDDSPLDSRAWRTVPGADGPGSWPDYPELEKSNGYGSSRAATMTAGGTTTCSRPSADTRRHRLRARGRD